MSHGSEPVVRVLLPVITTSHAELYITDLQLVVLPLTPNCLRAPLPDSGVLDWIEIDGALVQESGRRDVVIAIQTANSLEILHDKPAPTLVKAYALPAIPALRQLLQRPSTCCTCDGKESFSTGNIVSDRSVVQNDGPVEASEGSPVVLEAVVMSGKRRMDRHTLEEVQRLLGSDKVSWEYAGGLKEKL